MIDLIFLGVGIGALTALINIPFWGLIRKILDSPIDPVQMVNTDVIRKTGWFDNPLIGLEVSAHIYYAGGMLAGVAFVLLTEYLFPLRWLTAFEFAFIVWLFFMLIVTPLVGRRFFGVGYHRLVPYHTGLLFLIYSFVLYGLTRIVLG